MSLDVMLVVRNSITTKGTGVFIKENGNRRELTISEVREKYPNSDVEELEFESEYIYSSNITHNLGEMADKAGIYYALWRPEEIGKEKAADIIDILKTGLADLKARPEYFEQFNSSNGWGMYENFVPFVENYLNACIANPDAIIEISR